MRGTRRRSVLTLVVAFALLAAACGNSEKKAAGTSTTADDGAPPATALPGENVPVDAPGVTDDEIRVGGVVSVENPLGGKYGDAYAGVEAYFKMVNDAGGIYGRELVLGPKRDDGGFRNSQEVQALLTEDIFAALPIATLLFTGAQALVDEGIPTFGFTINTEWEGNEEEPRANLFGQSGSFLCFNCASPVLPWLAKELGAKRIGVLAYAVPQAALCADGIEAAFEKYGDASDAEVVFVDKSLAFQATSFSVQVERMKQEGVDLVTACMDTNGVVSIAKEMKLQDLDAVQYLPNAYDHEFLDEFGDLFEGSYVRTDFVPWEVEDKPEALQTYLDAMEDAGEEPSENSLVGWINADMFVTGLREAGPEFSRQKVIDAINELTDYDAGGILHGVDWTKQHTELAKPDEGCQVLTKITDSEFDPVYTEPGKPFVCVIGGDGSELTSRFDP